MAAFVVFGVVVNIPSDRFGEAILSFQLYLESPSAPSFLVLEKQGSGLVDRSPTPKLAVPSGVGY